MTEQRPPPKFNPADPKTRRYFTAAERAAIAELYDNKCSECGAPALAFTDDPGLRGHAG